MHETHRRGSTAEAAIALAAIRQGFGVFRPLNDGERYDIILDVRPALLRVRRLLPRSQSVLLASDRSL